MASTEYYSHTGYPAFGSLGSSAPMRAELDKIQVGFSRMPDLAGNAGKVVVINALATGMDVATTTGTGNFVRANDPTFILTDLTTNNSTTLAHGWLPKLSGSTSQFLRGDGNWSPPPTFSLIEDVRTTNSILVAADTGKEIKYTSGTFTQTLSAAATLGSGWLAYLNNFGTGTITIDPNGAETIDGAATFVLAAGVAILLICNGTSFSKIILQESGVSEVVVNTGNGFGSTNTQIRRFTTTQTNTGSAITYADSATLGASFTINEDGIYAMTFVGQGGGSGVDTYVGISLNSAQLSTAIELITAANRLGVATATTFGSVSRVQRLVASDVIRPHCTLPANAVNAQAATMFSIRKLKVL